MPDSVMELYVRLRYGGHPAATVHAMPRADIESFMTSLGAKVLDVQPNRAAGENWESFEYCCGLQEAERSPRTLATATS